MTQSDLDQLLDMGFEQARAALAVKHSGGLHGALEWLEKNQDKPLEDLQAEADENAAAEPKFSALGEGQEAKSLVCNECGKLFRNQALAQYHATKTEHTDFSESVEEIAPLTEEEKQAKLEALRLKLEAKRANKAVEDQHNTKQNEQIRLKSTRESQDLKDDLKRKLQNKEVEEKRQEKLADIEAKRRIKAKIEADKEDRRLKAEAAKAARSGQVVPSLDHPGPSLGAQTNKIAANHSEARLRLQTSAGSIVKTLPADTTLFEVAQLMEKETGKATLSLSTTYPKKVYSAPIHWGWSLKKAGLVPSAVLIVESDGGNS